MIEQVSIGRDAAIALAESEWWIGKSPDEIARIQFGTRELCMPFDVFHQSVEAALGRPVWTHEFARMDLLMTEMSGDRPAPTMDEIVAMVPEDKRLLVRARDVEETTNAS